MGESAAVALGALSTCLSGALLFIANGLRSDIAAVRTTQTNQHQQNRDDIADLKEDIGKIKGRLDIE